MRLASNLLMYSALAAAIITYLTFAAARPTVNTQNFRRLFPPHVTLRENIFSLGVNSFYIAGVNDDSIYLGNSTVPGLVVRLGNSLSDSFHTRYPLQPFNMLSMATHVQIDSNTIDFFD